MTPLRRSSRFLSANAATPLGARRTGPEGLWKKRAHDAELAQIAEWFSTHPGVQAKRIREYCPEQWQGTIDGSVNIGPVETTKGTVIDDRSHRRVGRDSDPPPGVPRPDDP
jgi:hypothetical protein